MPPRRKSSRFVTPNYAPPRKMVNHFSPPLQYGEGWSDFTNWVKGAANTVYTKALVPAGNWIKDNHVLSEVAGIIPHPAGKAAAMVLRQAGLGKQRRQRRFNVIRT